MIRLIILILKQYIHCFKRREPLSSTNVNKGFKMYFSAKDTKNIFRVIAELSWLCNKWRAFPDSYFRFRMFLKTYTDREQMASFIPQGAYARFSVSKDSRYNILIDDKILFHDLMSLYHLPVPHRFFIYRNNQFRCAAGEGLLTDTDVNKIINAITDSVVFVKFFTGGAATGVSVFTRDDAGNLIDTDRRKVSAEMIREVYANRDIFLEKKVQQEPVLGAFNPDTANSIRVLTYKGEIISAAVRFGRKNEYVDNASKGGLAVSLDINTGVLGDYGDIMYDIKKYYEHPDTHLKFANVYVSQWEEVKSLIQRVQSYLPYYNSVGFDIVTTENGPVILEINTGAGVNLSQMGKEYGIAKFFI